jgi:hypothetical protein
LELPSELTEPLSWIGLIWPEADEDKLFEAGQKWISYAGDVQQTAGQAYQQAATVWSDNQGDTVDAFKRWYERSEGPETNFLKDSAAAMIIGAALIVFAAITLALKIAFIVQLVILAIEVAQAIATAIASFGATMAEVPGFMAATRVFCKQLIKQVVEHIQTVIKDLLEKAKNLLKFFSKDGRAAAKDLEKGGAEIPGVMTDKKYDGKAMLDKYEHETKPGDPRNPFSWMGDDAAVKRLSPAEREQYRVFLDDDGVLRSATDGQPFDTSAATSLHSADGGKAIFVMDEQGNMYASKTQELGQFHHSTLGNGQPVAAAGELQVTNGRIDAITAKSGHYQPTPANMSNMADALGQKGVTGVPVYGFDGSQWF